MQQSMFVLNAVDTIANHLLLELRDPSTQSHRGSFRRNLVKLGQIMAYELSKSLEYGEQEVETVLGRSKINTIKESPVLFTIIRAGLPFLAGFQEVFENADCGFIGAHRMEGNGEEISVDLGYSAIPNFENKHLIVVDPMLATGKSLISSLEVILQKGTPKMLHLAFAIAAPEGIDYVQQKVKVPHRVWIAAVDDHLNQNSYIVPGLGDAGDLLFGNKI